MEGFSSINRIVGKATDERKEAIVKEKEILFKEQPYPRLERLERAKTPEEAELISLANEATNAVRERLGLDAFEIPPENIHVVPEEEWINMGEKGEAFYNPGKQAIVIREQASKLALIKIIVHELLHFKSYNALQVTAGDEKVAGYRTGLKLHTRDGKTLYFRSLDEAIIEELTKRIVTELKQNPHFTEEVKKTDKIVEKYSNARSSEGEALFNEDTLYADVQNKKSWGPSVGRLFGLGVFTKIQTNRFTYPQEREMLDVLMDKIVDKNPEKFTNKEEVFQLFIKGVMTGNILEIGKLIDSTFGAGMFRYLGEESPVKSKIDHLKSI